MEPNARFRRNVRRFYALVGSMAVFLAGQIAAARLVDHATTPARATAVLLGVGSMLPLMWGVVSVVRLGDEFIRQLHLLALAVAFGGVIIVILTLGLLVRAEFIGPPDLMLVLLGCFLVWLVALVVVKHHFERTR